MEIQQQLPHPTQHMNTGDIIPINALEFDPDIDGGPPMKEHEEIQGSDSSIQHLLGESKKSEAPALPQVAEEVDCRMQYQSRLHHNQPRIMTTTYEYHQHNTRRIIVKYLTWRLI